MSRAFLKHLACLACFAVAMSCSMEMDTLDVPGSKGSSQKSVTFPISVMRDGESIPEEAISAGARGVFTRAENPDASDMIATMDKSIPFGLIGIDQLSNALLIDNVPVSSNGGGDYKGFFDKGLWDIPTMVTFSAYYPHVETVMYGQSYESYTIPFQSGDTEAGPLVSKTVQRAMDQLNMVPLEFQHITNDIGFKICDVTVDPQLQGLIHLRKVTATRVASAGIFVNDLSLGQGFWHRQAYYRDVVVFEGDAVVGVGMENEKFIGSDKLVDHMVESNRYYAVPDEIKMGKQCVEVIYDIDSFSIEGFTYSALKNQKAMYMLYGVLPDNVMEYGKQYTFHLGLDTGKIYKEITFSASVAGWETKIYESNDEF